MARRRAASTSGRPLDVRRPADGHRPHAARVAAGDSAGRRRLPAVPARRRARRHDLRPGPLDAASRAGPAGHVAAHAVGTRPATRSPADWRRRCAPTSSSCSKSALPTATSGAANSAPWPHRLHRPHAGPDGPRTAADAAGRLPCRPAVEDISPRPGPKSTGGGCSAPSRRRRSGRSTTAGRVHRLRQICSDRTASADWRPRIVAASWLASGPRSIMLDLRSAAI